MEAICSSETSVLTRTTRPQKNTEIIIITQQFMELEDSLPRSQSSPEVSILSQTNPAHTTHYN
jgi:hypothetical protein